MKKLTLVALRGSIEKWERIVAGTDDDRGVANCPLCTLFYERDCTGCPVAKEAKNDFCRDTPYQDYVKFMGMSVVIDEKFTAPAVSVPRTWRERLFTRPWHPFTKFTAIPGEPEFFIDSYHNRLYTCRRGLDALNRAINARNELARKYT